MTVKFRPTLDESLDGFILYKVNARGGRTGMIIAFAEAGWRCLDSMRFHSHGCVICTDSEPVVM